MSGSSAIASARRRRTAPNEQIQNNGNTNNTNNTNNNTQNQSYNQNNNLLNEKITPLELLQQHEEKISFLEKMFHDKKDNPKINPEIHLDDNLKKFIKNEIQNFNTIYMKNLDDLKTEMDTIKMLLIKNQTLSLETNTEIINIKNTINLHNKEIKELKENINNFDNIENSNNYEKTKVIFENLLMSELSNINNTEEYENIEEDNFNTNKLVIEDNNTSSLDIEE